MTTLLFFLIAQIIYIGALVVTIKVCRIAKPTPFRFVAVLLLSEVGLGMSWGLSQVFIPLGIVGLVLQFTIFSFILRVKPAKAFVALLLWDALTVVVVTLFVLLAKIAGITLA